MALFKRNMAAAPEKMTVSELESQGFSLNGIVAKRGYDNVIRYRCDECRLWVENVEYVNWNCQVCHDCLKRNS